MTEENNQESTVQETTTVEQAEPEKKESLDDILNQTVTEQSKETDNKAELTTQDKQPESEAKTETEPTKTESLLPKDNFTQAEKDYFNSLDEAGKKVMLDKWGNLESGFNKKYESIANERKTIEGLKQIYEPYENDLKLMGMTPMQYTKNLVNIDLAARKDPVKFIQWFAQNQGVDLTKLNQTPEEQDPTTQELNSLKGEIGNLKQELSQREQLTNVKQVDSFKNAKDENGNLKYPHFDEVANEMLILNKNDGVNDLTHQYLESIYNKAVRMNDAIYHKQLDAEFAKRQAEQQKQADLVKAKKAGRPLKSSPSVNVSKNNKVSLDQILDEELK